MCQSAPRIGSNDQSAVDLFWGFSCSEEYHWVTRCCKTGDVKRIMAQEIPVFGDGRVVSETSLRLTFQNSGSKTKLANKVLTRRPKRKCHCNLVVSFWHISEFISSCDMSWPTTNDVILSGTMAQSSIAVVSSSSFSGGSVSFATVSQRKGGRRRRRIGLTAKKCGSASEGKAAADTSKVAL